MKKWILLSAIVIVAFSCKKDKEEPPVSNEVKYKAVLNAANEVATVPVVSGGTGEANAVFNKETKVLTVTITYSGLTAALSAWHIHKAAAGTNGGVVFNFGTPQASGFVYTSPALTSDQENDLFNTLYYVNLHTSTYPGGEIRGQLVKQ
jgi:Cu/Zn superoxide dismutase